MSGTAVPPGNCVTHGYHGRTYCPRCSTSALPPPPLGQARSAATSSPEYALTHPDGPFKTSDLPPGSLVVEKYRYTTRSGSYTGVQWLAQSVDKDGNLLLHEVCRTRKEALEVLSRV